MVGNDNLVGRVVSGSDRPLAGRIVIGERRDDRSDASGPVGHGTTDDDGLFVIEADGGVDVEAVSFTVRDPMRGGSEESIRRRERPADGRETIRLTVSERRGTPHGGTEHRGMNEAACTRAGAVRSHRFYTQFPELDTYDRSEELIRTLGGADGETDAPDADGAPMMESPDDPVGDAETPAAYGIFGQFVDHDLTFDPTSDIDRRNDPAALRNFRTPALDLDSVYRHGSETAPFLYDHDGDEAHLITGEAEGAPDRPDGLPGTDLQRNEQGVALIGDPRNDETVLVSQLQLAFVNFHNRVVDHLRGPGSSLVASDETVLEAAQRLVRWHYQWIVRHDFLPRICDEYVLDDVERNGRRFFLPEGSQVAIAVEFAGAAYRFGHSMIRDAYDVNDRSGNVPLFPSEPNESPTLRGFGPVDHEVTVDWTRLLDTGDGAYQRSRKIDALLPPALFNLPMAGEDSLAVRNLLRGEALGLPAGQDVARRMGIDPIRNEEFGEESGVMQTLRRHGRGADPDAPLWYYILDEARYQQDGERLGAVGSRIVAETLIGLVERDETAYPNAAPDGWEPSLPRLVPTGGYTLADLTAFAEEARPDGLVIDSLDPVAAPGDDPTDESVTLRNDANDPVDLDGYVLDLGGQRDTLPAETVPPGSTLTIRIGGGTDSAGEIHLSREAAALNDDGDAVTLLTPDGEVSTRRVYD
ncbi:peroxidase family protein [Halorubrum halophilum]|uniref:peroxidase family protein n=1 Tax=Halorubrum halophilum TaxID=413816 RepID=UPI00186B0F86|nr:peroxidase family protein [Halorubrum halophilum]